ncbi:MAG TPA: hypothetical protein VKA08_08720 [Balneolales bacterium]|nr:hypothetical protein [Balneolales bacterium]
MNQFFKISAFILLIGVVSAQKLNAQVVIYPTRVYIDHLSRFGTYYVSNKSQQKQEVTISTKFGYPVSDSLGNMHMNYADSVAARIYSANPWVRIFPKKFILDPGKRQVVKLLVSPTGKTKDQVYWTRLITKVRPVTNSVDPAKSAANMRIIFVVNYVTTILYQNGNILPDPVITNIGQTMDSTGVNLYARVKRTGNTPFIGKIRFRVSDKKGKVLLSETNPIEVYFNMVKHFKIPRNKLKPGEYEADVSMISGNEDLAQKSMSRLRNPVDREVTFVITGN